MRKIAAPITTRLLGREDKAKIVKQLRELNAEHVFIGIGSPKTDEARRKAELELLKESCDYFAKEGFKTTVWLWCFLVPGETTYQHIVSAKGITAGHEICPLDEEYRKFYAGYLKDIAEYVKPNMILFDDDFGLGFLSGIGIGCFCPNHLKMMSELAGEEIALEGIDKKVFCGKPNKYRDSYIEATRRTLIGFADYMRDAVDSVNPEVRMGVCSIMSAWNTDGVGSYEIAHHLAGKHRPFVRLIGAPYWGINKLSGNNRLQDVINLQRMESSWRDSETEVFYEGDVYPRPRFATPANFLEIYDMALLAGGNADTILKYAIDFNSYEGYEKGYIERHKENQPKYDWITENMKGKPEAGIRVYEFMHTVKTAELPDELPDFHYVQDRFMTPASKIMSTCSVPIAYSGKGSCGVAFGENVRYLTDDERKSGLIIDLGAAKVLEEMGVDVGIREWGEEFRPFEEYYHTEDVFTWVRGVYARKVKLDEKAVIQSSFTPSATDTTLFPASYVYENAEGYKFMVFTFEPYKAGGTMLDPWQDGESVYRQYARSRQLQNAPEILSGKKLPVKVNGNPDLYVIAKEDGDAMSVGLWNIFPDSANTPKIELGEAYSRIETCSCKAKLNGNIVELSTIAPYGFAGFKVYK